MGDLTRIWGRRGHAKCKSEDADGKWPCAAVRHMATEIKSEPLASDMAFTMTHPTGSGFRASGGGRRIAQDFREKADKIRFDSTFVGQILVSVAECYEREARWWDERDRWESD